MINRLLVVDRNPRDLRVIEVSSRVAGYDVEAFNSLEAATEAILAHPALDLLIAADDSPDFDAFALCGRLRANLGSRDLPILLLLQNFTQQARLRAIAAGADDALAKPVSTAEVLHRTHALCRRRNRDRLLRSTTPSPGDQTGNLADLPAVDLLAIFETWGRSGILHLRSAAGANAAIYFRGGKPVDAEAGGISGTAALARIFSWEGGTFRIELKTVRRADSLPGSVAELVMAGLGERNASETQLRTAVDRNVVLTVDSVRLVEERDRLSPEQSGLLRLFDGKRTVRSVIDASALSDDEALEALTDSLARGILQARPVRDAEYAENEENRAESWARDRAASMAEGDLPVPTGELPAQDSSAHEVDDRDVLGVRAPEPPVLPPPPPSRTSSRSEPAPGGAVADPVPLEGNAEPSSRLERALLKHEAADAEAVAAVTSAPVAAEPASDAVAPHFNMNATLPLGLAGADVPEHFRALILETAGSEPFPEPPPAAEGVALGEASGRGAPVVAHEPSDAPSPHSHQSDPNPDDGPAAPPPSTTVAIPALPNESHLAASTRSGPVPLSLRESAFAQGEDFTAEQALEELGLSSGKGRRLRWIAAALAVAALASLGVNRWSARRPAGSTTVAQVPSSVPQHRSPAAVATEVPAIATQAPAPATETSKVAALSPERPLPTPTGHASGQTNEPATPSEQEATTEHPALPTEKTAASAKEAHEKHLAPEPAHTAPVAAEVQTAPRAEEKEKEKEPEQERSSPSALAACRVAVDKHGRHRSAKACEAAVLANPHSAEALTLLAGVEMNRGRMKRAQELATQAAEIDPALADAYAILGGVLQDSGKEHEAKLAYRKYLRLAPNGRYAGELRSIVGTM